MVEGGENAKYELVVGGKEEIIECMSKICCEYGRKQDYESEK
jgi:hypothetical protein